MTGDDKINKESSYLKKPDSPKTTAKRLVTRFINSNLSARESVNTFISDILDYLESSGFTYSSKSRKYHAHLWIRKVYLQIEKLKKFRREIASFVRYISNPRCNFTDKEYYKLQRDLILRKAETISKRKYVDSFSPKELMSIVCGALMLLTQDKFPFFRPRLCKECKKSFRPKTLRDQWFCSDKCRFKYHNTNRIQSGKHSQYMKKWREMRQTSK
jgi:hypothetical protein